MRLCVMQRRATSLFIGNNTLTIRTFLFSLRLLAPAHACSSIFCVFLFYRGSPGDRGALHCHWNAIATQPIGLVPFQARGILQRPEEQSRTGSCQGSSVAGQPQCPRLWHSSTPNARFLSHSPSAHPPPANVKIKTQTPQLWRLQEQ